MSKSHVIEATPRTVLGKKVRALRRDGILPANVYGNGVESTAIQINSHDFQRVFPHLSNTTLIDLKIGKKKAQKTLLKAYQFNPTSGTVTHADFFVVNMREKMKADVAVVLIGEPKDNSDSVITQHLSTISVEALPADLPASFNVDISGLYDIGDGVKVSDLQIPEGVTILTDPDESIVSATAAQKVEEEPVAEVGAAEGTEETTATHESGVAASEPAAE